MHSLEVIRSINRKVLTTTEMRERVRDLAVEACRARQARIEAESAENKAMNDLAQALHALKKRETETASRRKETGK